MSPLLADVVLVVHFAFVLFVVGGLALIWIGGAAGWQWVRGFWFRAAHLAAIAPGLPGMKTIVRTSVVPLPRAAGAETAWSPGGSGSARGSLVTCR